MDWSVWKSGGCHSGVFVVCEMESICILIFFYCVSLKGFYTSIIQDRIHPLLAHDHESSYISVGTADRMIEICLN